MQRFPGEPHDDVQWIQPTVGWSYVEQPIADPTEQELTTYNADTTVMVLPRLQSLIYAVLNVYKPTPGRMPVILNVDMAPRLRKLLVECATELDFSFVGSRNAYVDLIILDYEIDRDRDMIGELLNRVAAMPRCREFQNRNRCKYLRTSEFPMALWNVFLDRTEAVLRVLDVRLSSYNDTDEEFQTLKNNIENLLVAALRKRRLTNRAPRVVFHVPSETLERMERDGFLQKHTSNMENQYFEITYVNLEYLQ